MAQGFRGSRFYAEPSLLPVNLADTQAIAIVGAAPPFLPEAPLPGKALLWGTLEPEADTYLLKGLTIRRVQKAPLGVDYVTGTAHVQGTEGRPVVAIHPEDIKKISETPLSIPRDEFFRYFTCYCDPSELAPVAADMTQASLDKGLHRAFYAIGYEGLAGGPQERSFLWGSLLGELVRFFAVLALWGLIVMGAQMYWVRRAPVYATDRFCGAPGWQLHLRLQSLILLSLILPAALGFAAFVMINPFAFDSVQLPYPLLLHLVILWALGILALLYLSAGLPVMLRMKRLIDYPVKEVADV
ncbi:MAG: hypothetical protein KM310_02875 [Clostridiales bacterium]|nr:hypothetical protein [Clostridiales bacterium]